MQTPVNKAQNEEDFLEKPQLYAHLVKQLYDLLPIGLSATVLNAAILVLVHWKVLPHAPLLVWFAAMISIVVLQSALLLAYRHNTLIFHSPSAWGNLFIGAGALNGLGWGSLTLFLFPRDSLVHQVFLAFLQGGMLAGAAGAFPALLEAYLAFSAPAFLPTIFTFFIIGDEMHLAMGSLLVIFAGCMTVCARRVNMTTLSSFRKGLENLDLVSDLTESNERLERTNVQLQHEISERRKAEEALRKSESTYRAIFEHTGAATIILEEDETISLVNSQCEKFSGYSRSEVEGRMKLRQFIADDEDAPRLIEYHHQRRVDGGVAPTRYEFRFRDKSGTVRDTMVTVGMIPGTKRSVASLVDITDKKKMEEEYLKVEKLESLGILAGGIAHDFNNILTAIMGNISLAKVFAQDKVRSRLEEAEKASAKARDLTQQLLSFAKAGTPVKKTLSLSELIKESTAFALSGSNVRCQFSIPDGLWLVDVDEGQISRVLTNLVINAAQAMPQGGTIQVSAENMTSWAQAPPRLPLEPGKYVRIAVRDEGAGIPVEHLPKIFDPYFSTKEKGSGLGLATAFSIINNHGGYITVDSKQGDGSTFHFYLPTSRQQVAEISEMKKRPQIGRGRILVMEDGDEVRRILGEMLEHLGYDVDSVLNGAELIRKYQQSRDAGRRYDLVIMDLTIPGGMGGKETIKQLLELDPRARAIVSSGYSNDPVMADFAHYGFAGFISKPYKIEELSELLKKVIGAQKGQMLQYRAS